MFTLPRTTHRVQNETLQDKVVLVTGGAGFIGSHLCDKLLARRLRKLIVVDDFSVGRESNIAHLRPMDNVEVLKADASDYDNMSKLIDREEVDVVFNMAVVPLPASLDAPKQCIDNNVLVTSTCCELLRAGKYQTLIHCSSSEAYGTAVYVPMDESHPITPLTPYAASKIASDHIALSYHRTFGLDLAIARPFNAYGPRQNEGSYAAVVPITIKRIIMGQPPVIHGDGLQTRDYTYVEDIVEAIPKIYEVKSTRGLVINLATGKEITIKNLIHMIMKLLNCSSQITYERPRPGDVRRHRGDISLAKKLIDYSPKTDYDTGLGKTIAWYRSILHTG